MTAQACLLLILVWSSSTVLAGQVDFGDCPGKPRQGAQDQDLSSASVLSRGRSRGAASARVSVAELQIPRNARSTLRKASEALHKKNPSKAIGYIDKAIDLYPRFSQALAMRALLERDTHPEQAQVDAEKAVEYDSAFSNGYVALASVYIALGKFDDAIRALNYAIAANPEAWQGYYEMSRAFVGKRDYTAAFHQMETTCSLLTEAYPFLHLAKADILIGLKNDNAAARELEAYLAEEPDSQDSPRAKSNLASLRTAGHHE